ncbi:hypothetical protein MSAN_00652000 [Mycena sanguinolenta]|uniref:Uncharacterized protein n=1 Tax=Mycena sanguinolenta TaxID=230812 RepID=A0A8H7DEM6_9AGAR|nr:hypothetical protein MSAN_00652000 [Mycena sanguinolenta]
MAQKLPREIIDLVVGEFQLDNRAEKRTIAQCGLVCKSWFPSSRYRLFSDVNVDDHTITSFLDAVDNSLFAIPIVIRSLGLSFSGGENTVGLDESLRRLGPLPLVVALRLTMKDEILLRSLPLLRNTFSNISALGFRTVPLHINSIFRTVSAFQSLKSLQLDWVSLSYADEKDGYHGLVLFSDDDGEDVDSDEEANEGKSYQLPPQWNSLALDLLDNYWDSQKIFATILSLNPIPILSSLAVREIDPAADAPMGKYLARLGNALTYLRLESGPLKFFHHDIGGLKHCTGLRRLDLEFHCSSRIANTVLDVLQCLRCRNLVEVNIFDSSGGGHFTAIRGWEQLDAKLAEEQFAQVQTFRVESKSLMLVSETPRCMPLSQARGILQLSEA